MCVHECGSARLSVCIRNLGRSVSPCALLNVNVCVCVCAVGVELTEQATLKAQPR